MGKKKSKPSGDVVEVTKILDDDLAGEDLTKPETDACANVEPEPENAESAAVTSQPAIVNEDAAGSNLNQDEPKADACADTGIKPETSSDEPKKSRGFFGRRRKSKPSGDVVEVTKLLDDDVEKIAKAEGSPSLSDSTPDVLATEAAVSSEIIGKSNNPAAESSENTAVSEAPAIESDESTVIPEVPTTESAENTATPDVATAEPVENTSMPEVPVDEPSENTVVPEVSAVESAENTIAQKSDVKNAEESKPLESQVQTAIPVNNEKEFKDNQDESCDSPEKKPKKKKHKAALIIIIILAVIIVAIYIAGVVFGNYYFYPNTYINQAEVSWMDAEESNNLLLPKDKEFVVSTRTGEETISLTDIDYEIHLIHSTEDLIHDQDIFAWPAYFFKDTVIEDAYKNSYNLPALRDAVANLNACQTENMVKPTDAYIELGKDGHYSIIEATEGAQLDVGLATNAVVNAINGGLYYVDLDERDCYVKPKKYSDDPELNLTLNTLKALGEETITIDVTGATEVLDPYALMDFITYDPVADSITVKEEKLTEYVASLAAKYNTLNTQRTFTTHDGSQILVGGSGDDNYGFLMDQAATINVLRDAILAKQTQTITPVWTKTGWSRGVANGDIGVTYVEVSIASQTMWYYKDGQLFLETPVVTGLPDGGRNTPCGVFNAWSMGTNTRLQGSYNGSSWDCVVAYWVSVDNYGVGIHDATWQPYFGGDRYLTGGSHGCINTPLDAMGNLYNNLVQGTPIVIY